MSGHRRWRARALVLITTVGVVAPQLAGVDSARAAGDANLHLDKTVGAASLSPLLSLTLGVDRSAAIPRDTLTYTATVTNTGAVLGMSGDLVAQNTAATAATVSSYYDAVATASNSPCGAGGTNSGHDTSQWTPLAGVAAAQSGYTPVIPAPVASGLQLQVTPVAASGVNYPSSGDLILGTQLAPGAQATWHYTASISLTPAQVAFLLDPTRVSRIRNTLHVEPTPRTQPGNGQPPTMDVDFCRQLFSTTPSGAASNVSVTITPQAASPVTIDQSTVPGLASIASGASVSAAMQYTVPRVAARRSDESDADYLARLASVEGSTLQATATAAGTGSGGPLSAGPAVSPPTTEHVPIMGIAKSGPATANAGTTQNYPLALSNTGGATAGALSVTDSVPDGTTGTVTGVPATLAPSATATASAAFPIPTTQPDGGLTDTAAVAWQDANGNAYGPVSSQFTTQVRATLAGATLTLTPPSAGPDVVGGQQTFTATFLDRSGNPLGGRTLSFGVTGVNANTGSAVTSATGVATFAYTGSHGGVDVAQASFTQGSLQVQSNTGTVGWITPITPISTGTVQGNFFPESSSATSFVAKPGDVPAFGQSFPTIDFNPPSGAELWLGNDTSGNLIHTDTAGTVLSQVGAPVTGVAWDGANLYVADSNGNITKRSADGTTVVDSMSIHNAGSPSEDLAWDSKRKVLWRIDHSPATLDEIDPVSHTLLNSHALPQSDAAAPAMTPLGGLGIAYDPGNDRLYLSFCQTGCSGLQQGLVRIVDPATMNVVGDLFQSPFMTGGLAIDTGSDTLWVGDQNVVRNTTLHGAVLSSFPRPQPGGFVDGLELVRTSKTPIVNHNVSGVGPQTRPFTDVTTDQLGNYTGTIVAQGNGVQAGVGSMQAFNAVLTSNFTVAKPGDVTFDVVADDGFMLGVSGGATRVSGAYENAPPSNTSPFLGYPLMGAFNQSGGNTPGTYRVTVHFPAAGSYPYELDYFECCGAELSLTLTVEQFTADTSPLSVYAAYADGLRPAGSIFPFPWDGSPGVTFIGNGQTPYDSGALRFDNNSDNPIVLDDVAVDVGPYHFDLWGSGITLQPHVVTILTQTSGNNFDSSDTPITCSPTGYVPQVHYTIAGVTTTFADTTQVLNTKGIDPPSCGLGNESIPWTRIGGGGTPINVPLPPAVALSLTPTTVSGDTVGSAQALTVTAVDGSGNPVAALPVTFSVFGPNTQTLSATTDVHGVAHAAYTGAATGSDTVTATAFVTGLRNVSNALTVPWVLPAPAAQPPPTSSGPTAPQIANLVPANNSVISGPTPVTATITAPSGASIASYSVTVQNTATSSTTTIGSGSGTPTPLANLDPTLFGSGTYVLTLSATSSSGGTATVGNLVVIGSGGGTVSQTPPTISTPSPADGTKVTAPVPITATLTPPSGQTIASWAVTAQAQDPEPPVTLASGTGAPPSPLTTLDPSLLANDTYAITVSATASGGGTQSSTTTIAVAGNLKLGRYVTSFEDLNVPVNGLPMRVTRGYDSIDRRSGDFGVGWKVDVANFRVSSNRSLGLGGWTVQPTQCFFGLCLYGFTTSAPHYVTVTFPDNHQETFDFTPANTGGVLFYWQGSAAFTARQGVTSTLAVDGDPSLTYGFDGSLYDGNLDPYNPTAFVLTTVDGRVLHLTTTSGLVSETDTAGNTLSIDSSGVHSSNGQSITFARDGAGRITTITGPSAQTLAYTYSAAGDLGSVTDPAGNVTNYTYDSSHHLLSTTGTGGRPQRTLTYDASGRLISITDADGNVATLSSDVSGRQQIIQDPNGHLTTVDTFDDAGDLLRQDKVFGTTTQTTRWTYDPVGRMLTQTDANGGVITFTYDATGAALTTTDANGRTTTYTRNARGEPLTVAGPDGAIQRTLTYDAHGRLLTQTHPDGSHSSYTYDSRGNVLTSTDELGHVTTRTYDSGGHLLTLTDPAGGVTTYTYDASGHPLTIADALGRTSSFSYDGNGHITQILDPQGRRQTFTYNAVGHITSAVDASNKTTTYTYDAVGRLAKRVDRNGGATTYTYDADSSMLSETLPDSSQTTYTYDPFERPASVTNAAETVSYTYTALGSVASQATAANGGSGMPGVTLSFTYDPAGAQLTETGPEGTTSYAYDVNSRITSVTAPGGQVYGFGYDVNGRLASQTRPNGVSDSLAYDAAGHLLTRTSTLGAAVVAQSVYAYEPSGLRTSMTDTSGTNAYTYDAAGELLSATHPASTGLPAETYTYNTSGDRISSATDPAGSIAYDAGGHLTADATHTYQYDAEGDLVHSTVTATGATTSYAWDADHRLTSVTHPDGSVSSYTYDGLGRRIAVQDPAAAATRYVYDGSNVHLEYGAGNTLQAAYAQTLVIGGVLAQSRGGQNSSYVQDGQGSTTALLDSSGHVSASYNYDTFGRPAASNPSSPPQTYSYTGQTYDSASGLYYMRARYYDPGTGRFLSEDPVQSANRYAYVGNDPTNLVDPTGAQELVEETETIAIDEELDATAVQEEESALCEAASALDPIIGAGKSVNLRGSLAEQYVADNFLGGLAKNTTISTVSSGAGRIPDFISPANEFFEVKNVASLSYTQQLRDFVELAGNDNPVNIFIRAGTKVSGPLADAEQRGLVKLLRCLPG